jgi:hypothetical protein
MQLNSVEGEIGDGIGTRSLEEYGTHEVMSNIWHLETASGGKILRWMV